MSQAVADAVQHLRVIAVNGSYTLAPWAEALAANDGAWWRANPEAMNFAGRKFSTSKIWGLERILPCGMIGSNTCSGVLGLELAKTLGAKRILLLGADFHGSHFFGDYAGKLNNTTEARRLVHAKQFARWKEFNDKVEVLNCTPGSRLTCFPMADLKEVA